VIAATRRRPSFDEHYVERRVDGRRKDIRPPFGENVRLRVALLPRNREEIASAAPRNGDARNEKRDREEGYRTRKKGKGGVHGRRLPPGTVSGDEFDRAQNRGLGGAVL
jgi:hypothetical protein